MWLSGIPFLVPLLWNGMLMTQCGKGQYIPRQVLEKRNIWKDWLITKLFSNIIFKKIFQWVFLFRNIFGSFIQCKRKNRTPLKWDAKTLEWNLNLYIINLCITKFSVERTIFFSSVIVKFEDNLPHYIAAYFASPLAHYFIQVSLYIYAIYTGRLHPY